MVALLQSYETQLARERQRHLEQEMAARREREKLEELEREKLRQEKRAAKERRREEARHREAETRREADLKTRHEMQVNGNGNCKNAAKTNTNGKNGYGRSSGDSESKTSCLASLLMFTAGLAVAGLGLASRYSWTTVRTWQGLSSQITWPVLSLNPTSSPKVTASTTRRLCLAPG